MSDEFAEERKSQDSGILLHEELIDRGQEILYLVSIIHLLVRYRLPSVSSCQTQPESTGSAPPQT